MAKNVNFFDGAQSSTTPTIGNVDTTNLVCYANDAAYIAANVGSPTEGNIYCNDTDNTIRYYNGTVWTELSDTATVQIFSNKTIDGTSATGTNTITIDADDASYDNTISGLTATNVKTAIDEVDAKADANTTAVGTAQGSADANTTDIADLRTTTGTADGTTDMGAYTGTVLTDNQTTKANIQELGDRVEAIGSPLVLKGNWNATTNSPALVSSVGTEGDFYIISVAGTTTLDGESDWGLGDWVVFGGGVWFKQDNSQTVDSVNGQTGAVSLALGDLSNADDAGAGSRDTLRRNIANSRWEDFNPNQVTTDNSSGSNVALAPAADVSLVRLTNDTLVSIDTIPAGYSGARTIISNTTTNVVTVNNDTGATAADRIFTGTGAAIDLDIDASLYLIYDGNESRWRVVGGSGAGGSGTSGIITGNDSTADSTEGDWVAYADAAGTTPVDGTGGAPNITLTRTTTASEILQGKGSFKITKGAFDRQGEGVSLDIPAPIYIRGQASQISFSYQTTANFDHGSAADPVGSPSDISVFLYDVTNSKILNVSQPGIFGGGLYRANVQIPSDCEDVRVIAHIATTSALAYDFIFDRVELDVTPSQFLTRANSVETKVLTANVSTSTTISDLTFSNLKIGTYYKATINSAHQATSSIGASTVTITHDSVGLAESRYDSVSLDNNGRQTSGMSVIFKATSTSLTFVSGADANDYIRGNSTQSETFAQLETLNDYEDVEVAAASGLNAKAVMRADKGGGSFTANVTIASWTNVDDSLDAFDATTGIYTVKSPGDYYTSVILAATTNILSSIRLNGTQVAESGGTGEVYANAATVLRNLKYGDELTVTTNVTATPSGATRRNVFSVHKIGSEQQPYAPRVAYLKDVKVSGAGGTFTSGAWQTRVLNDTGGDQSFVSLSSNQFTLQPGTYDIEAFAPAYYVDGHQIKLRNITDASDTTIGSSEFTDNSGGGWNTTSRLFDRISISSAKTFEIQHRCAATRASNGFGAADNFSVGSVYTQVKIAKVL